MLIAWGTQRGREGFHVCAVSVASLVSAVWVPAGALVALCARPFTESCNNKHLASSFPESCGCGGTKTSWEELWIVWGCMGGSLVKMIAIV